MAIAALNLGLHDTHYVVAHFYFAWRRFQECIAFILMYSLSLSLYLSLPLQINTYCLLPTFSPMQFLGLNAIATNIPILYILCSFLELLVIYWVRKIFPIFVILVVFVLLPMSCDSFLLSDSYLLILVNGRSAKINYRETLPRPSLPSITCTLWSFSCLCFSLSLSLTLTISLTEHALCWKVRSLQAHECSWTQRAG